INEYTRYATVVICLFQAWMAVSLVASPKPSGMGLAMRGYEGWFYVIPSILTMTVGTVFLMWIGEQIDEYGVGNGISLIIMAGIIARIPDATISLVWHRGWFKPSIFTLGGSGTGGDISLEQILVLIILFVAVVVAV